jgi:hypothetical protein
MRRLIVCVALVLTACSSSSSSHKATSVTQGTTTTTASSVPPTFGSVATTAEAATATGSSAAGATAGHAIACGTERWAVKTGQDPDAARVDQTHVQPTTIAELDALPAPRPEPSARFAPVELTVYEIHATLIEYKHEADRDVHAVISDGTHTMIVELPEADCTAGPFTAALSQARSTFDARHAATPHLQRVNETVTVRGVGFFDKLHGQTGVAPNGIELHPVLAISFS